MNELTPASGDRFSFGLWTVGNVGRDPFGGPVRAPLDPNRTLEKLAELGAWGVSLHDDDLVPPGASAQERDRIVNRFQQGLRDTGLKVDMATYYPLRSEKRRVIKDCRTCRLSWTHT